MQGKLICLYGIDGSGKSTILEMLNNSKLKNTVCTSCLKKAIFEEELYQAEKTLQFHRKDVFSHEFKHVLHIGSVIFRMYNEILPILDTGKNVILDRYVLCIKLFTELFLQPSCNCLSKALECLPNPDIGIYLNVDVDIAIARIQQRSRKTGIPPHYSESRQALILKQTKYEDIIPSEPYPIIEINANDDINIVYSTVLKLLEQLEVY